MLHTERPELELNPAPLRGEADVLTTRAPCRPKPKSFNTRHLCLYSASITAATKRFTDYLTKKINKKKYNAVDQCYDSRLYVAPVFESDRALTQPTSCVVWIFQTKTLRFVRIASNRQSHIFLARFEPGTAKCNRWSGVVLSFDLQRCVQAEHQTDKRIR